MHYTIHMHVFSIRHIFFSKHFLKTPLSYTRFVRKVSGLPLNLRAGVILHHRAGGILQSGPHTENELGTLLARDSASRA